MIERLQSPSHFYINTSSPVTLLEHGEKKGRDSFIFSFCLKWQIGALWCSDYCVVERVWPLWISPVWQVAVKNSIDVFYFSVLIPLNVFFVEDGKMGKSLLLCSQFAPHSVLKPSRNKTRQLSSPQGAGFYCTSLCCIVWKEVSFWLIFYFWSPQSARYS